MPPLTTTRHVPPPVRREDAPTITQEPPAHSYSVNPSSKALEIAAIRDALLLPNAKLLWEVLDKGRVDSHLMVRQNPFLQKLTKGGFCETEFMKYLVNLRPVHKALEEAQKKLLTIEYLSGFVMPELFRSEAIEQDLKIWEIVAAQEFVPWKPSDISLGFAKHISETAMSDPEKIIAIMYTLYGTIMSGGQKNKSVVEGVLKEIRELTGKALEGSGVSLYEIKNVKTPKELEAFKRLWHEKLCQVEVKLPAGRNIEVFHTTLLEEVNLTFKTVLEIIEQGVEKGPC
jgi:heme oxygenase (biliverdin-producing, ferredoxin)